MFIVSVLFIIGLLITIKGGDIFVDSAVWFARVTGMPNLLIGATIVSLATTLPELFVSSIASLKGSPEVAIGNAVGSTVCNIGLILALSVIFMPGRVNKNTLGKKGFLMIISTMIMFFFSLDEVMTFYEGLALIGLLLVYVYINLQEVKYNKSHAIEEIASAGVVRKDKKTVAIRVSSFILGTLLMVTGARLLVDNGIKLADFLGIPQAIISVTLIALGTSLPELTTTITAIVKKHHDISIGNIIGANILNVTMILGTSALLSSNGLILNSRSISVFNNVYNIPQTLYVDTPISLLLMSVVVIPGLIKGKLTRPQGVVMLGIYIAYLAFLGISL
jgi:cation:H+ antiporter